MKCFILSLIFAATAAALPGTTFKTANRLPSIKRNPLRRASQIIPVVVGGPQDTFVPNSITAAVGDIVQFQFSNGNHTVTQSTATTACTPMEGGVHSGHIPFQDGQTEVGTFNMPITSTEPMFLYCATGPHCQLGQVMMINPSNATQLAEYTKLSQQSSASVDGTAVVGGAAGKLALAAAAFVPAPPEEGAGGPPPGAAPPAAEAPPAGAPPAEAPPAEAPAAEAPAAESSAASTTSAMEAPAAETSAAAPAAKEAAAMTHPMAV